MTVFNLRTVKLRSGEQFSDARRVELEPLAFGGQRYIPVPESPKAMFTMTRVSSGRLFELEFDARLVGPCVRCLGDAAVEVSVRAREYQATSPDGSDELQTPYLVDDRLDLSAWARDAVALSLPDQILCREDCAGICPVCGGDLNLEPHEHVEQEIDPRWSALERLRESL